MTKCPDFKGRYGCDYFISNGACGKPTRFMCHIFAETGHQPVMDDVPLHVGEVLKDFDSAKVISTGRVSAKTRQIMRFIKEPPKKEEPAKEEVKKTMEDFFGKI